MPANTVRINGSAKMEWVIPDSKMEELIEKLNEVGSKEVKNPVEAIVGDKVVSAKYTNAKGELTGNLVLTFESGKTLFIAPITSELFFSPVDENK